MKKGNMSYDSVGKWEKYISKTNRPYHKFENQLITKHLKQKNTKNTKNKRSNSEQPFKLWKTIEVKKTKTEKITQVHFQKNFYL